MNLNFWSSSLHLPTSRITAVCHHAWLHACFLFIFTFYCTWDWTQVWWMLGMCSTIELYPQPSVAALLVFWNFNVSSYILFFLALTLGFWNLCIGMLFQSWIITVYIIIIIITYHLCTVPALHYLPSLPDFVSVYSFVSVRFFVVPFSSRLCFIVSHLLLAALNFQFLLLLLLVSLF